MTQKNAFTTLLLLLFITLKLCKVIAWSWWWVLMPAWLPLGVALCAYALVFAIIWRRAGKRSR